MANALLYLIALVLRIILVENTIYNNNGQVYEFNFNATEFVDLYEEVRMTEAAFEENRWTGAALILNNKTNEVKANEIFMKYKLEELYEYRNYTSENPAAMYFYDAKDKIENSKVYQIIKKMPKGANLYIHSLGSVSSDWLIKNFSYIDDLQLCTLNGNPVFTFRKNTENKVAIPGMNGTRLSQCQKLLTLRTRNDPEMYDRMLKYFFELEKSRPDGNVFKFGDAVDYLMRMYLSINDAVNYKPAFEMFHYQMLQEMYDDNIMYAEVRIQFLKLYDNTKTKYSREQTVETLINVVREFKKTHKDFLGVKFIYSVLRHTSMENVKKEVNIFKKLQKAFPNHIIGIDFVGWEDYSPPLKEYLREIVQLKKEGYNFYFFAGETNLQNEISDYNLYDALLLQSKRIGHGYALWKHPVIMNEIISKSIPIEICPATNQISGLVADLRNHPGGIYLSEDAPLVIGNDSPGFLGTTGLSTDFYYTIMSLASNKADLRTLKQLALNSILYSALSETRLAKARELFTEKWDKFLNEIVEDKI